MSSQQSGSRSTRRSNAPAEDEEKDNDDVDAVMEDTTTTETTADADAAATATTTSASKEATEEADDKDTAAAAAAAAVNNSNNKRKAEELLSSTTTASGPDNNGDVKKKAKEDDDDDASKEKGEATKEAAKEEVSKKDNENGNVDKPSTTNNNDEPMKDADATTTDTTVTTKAADESAAPKNEGEESKEDDSRKDEEKEKNDSNEKDDTADAVVETAPAATHPTTATEGTTEATDTNNKAEEQEAKNKVGEEEAAEVNKETKTTTTTPPKNPYDSLKYVIVRNDGKPESMIKLVGLKSLFSKQLPKMPRAYIARLVFDRRHTSLAILNHDNPDVKDSDDEIIGAICYRAFEDMRFAEIAFCAVNATHQVKGYGTKLMTLLKKIGAETGIEYFITYADNYAIGYFKKQGFSKSIQMPKGRYYGLIKDYDGGTMMECYVHPSIDFTRVPEMLEAQRQFIMQRIEQTAQSRTVYPPVGGGGEARLTADSNSLTVAAAASDAAAAAVSGRSASIIASSAGNGAYVTSVAALVAMNSANKNGGGTSVAGSTSSGTGGGMSRGNQSAARALAVPGMEQAGWTMADLQSAMLGAQGKESDRQKTALKTEFLTMIRKIEEQHFAWPFREPVDTTEVPDYLEVIKEPIDLSTIDKRIRQDNHYKSKQMLYQDLMLMVNNCKLYNEPSSPYAQCATNLETYLRQLFRKEDLPQGRG